MTRARRPLPPSLSIAASSEGDRVTTLELFFDLVYVFAFTQVTGLMIHGRPPSSLIDGFIVLSLMWWSWCAFSWLANQARANQGILQGAFMVAMVAVFISCLALPNAFDDEVALMQGAGAVVACYTVVRLTHASTYLLAAGRDVRMRRLIVATVLASLVPTVALLAVGAVVGEPAQRWLWLAAVLYDFAAVFVTAIASGGWLIQSAAHFAERHGLIVILALGESVVEIGVGFGHDPLDGQIAAGAVLSILVAVGLWFAYFGRLADRLDEALAESQGKERSLLGQAVFTYLHFPIIAGIIVAAAGLEVASARLDKPHLGAFGAWTLCGGVALFLAGTVATAVRAYGEWPAPRVVAIALLLVIAPLLALALPLVAVGAVAAVVLLLAVVEISGNPWPIG